MTAFGAAAADVLYGGFAELLKETCLSESDPGAVIRLFDPLWE